MVDERETELTRSKVIQQAVRKAKLIRERWLTDSANSGQGKVDTREIANSSESPEILCR